uniref:C2H2-type domain-containing protein n=1 Tax=Plectus sambesii TaxID=2011161 RepID=A0A914V4F0_9BILA
MRCHICDYDAGPRCIRDHLVAQHAQLVARSLLAPDLANPVDAWLMTCVEYSNAFRTAEAVVAEEEAEEGATDPLLLVAPGNDDAGESIALNGADVGVDRPIDHHQQDTEDGSDYFESLPVLNGNGLKMEIRLDGLATPAEQSPAPSDGDRQPNSRRRRKRTPTRRNEDGDALLLSGADANDVVDGVALQQSAGKRPKLEQFLTTDDKQCNQRRQAHDDYDENELAAAYGGCSGGRAARESPALSALNDSKAVRRVMCQLCRVDVCATARQRHVYLIHLKQPDLFTCSQCDYTNSNSIWETRKHCVAQHGSHAQAVSNEERHRTDIQAWNQRCFPEWKQKRPAFWWKMDEPAPVNFDQNSNSSFAADDSPDAPEDELDSEQVSLFDEDENSRSCSTKPPDGVVVDDRTCHLCWEESRYPGRHIAQKHLKKPLYECPVCEGFGSYESCTVAKHLIKVHPEHGETQPVSNLEKYADEIRDLQARCFPNRPMKL